MSTSMGDAGHDRSFQSRMNRVAEGRGSFGGGHPHVSVLPDWKREVIAKSGVVVAIALGLLSILIVRIAQYHYSGTALIGPTPMFITVREAGCAFLLSLMVMVLLPYSGLKFVVCLIAAIGGGTVAMHNAVHWSPGSFALMFSQQWTEDVTTTTEPNSLYVLGEVIPIAPPREEEKPLPTVLRLN